MINIIVAMDRDRIIGNKNTIPWHIPEDFKHFKQVTSGHIVIMGLNTYRSIGKPLSGRRNIVLSLDSMEIEGCEVYGSIPEALEAARQDEGKEIFFIGGASIYAQALPITERMYISYVPGEHEGDTHFPAFDADEWRIVDEQEHDDFTVVIYERKNTGKKEGVA